MPHTVLKSIHHKSGVFEPGWLPFQRIQMQLAAIMVYHQSGNLFAVQSNIWQIQVKPTKDTANVVAATPQFAYNRRDLLLEEEDAYNFCFPYFFIHISQ